MLNLPKMVAKLRLVYHSNMLDVVNAANQLHILSDEKAEKLNKNHTMIILTDLFPRLTKMTFEEIGEAISKARSEEKP